MLKGKPAVKKPESKTSKKAAKTSDALTKKALATVEANIARIEAEERGEKPKAPSKAKAAAKPAAKGKASKSTKEKRMSGLDAAAKVLIELKDPLSCPDLVKAMEDKGYWKSPGGKTPAATLHAAISREIKEKGKDSRFKKVDRGMFASNSGGK